MTTTVINTHVAESRAVPRIWLEGKSLARAGVEIGVTYAIKVSNQLRRIEMRPAPAGYAGKTVNVSKRTRNDREYPLIEVRDALIAELFEVGTKLRVAIQNGRILISPSHIAMRVKERVDRFIQKMKTGTALNTVSLFHGSGVIDSAIHHGLSDVSVKSTIAIAVEQETVYIENSLEKNPEIFNDDSTVIVGDIRDINLLGGSVPQAELLIAGLPCLGASKSGASKLGLKCAEEHATAGALFVDFLDWVKATNPAIIVVENVTEYSGTASMTAIRSVLIHQGYELSETVLDGHDLGALEKRKRMCLVATTPGACMQLNFDNLKAVRQREAKLADILEDVPADSDSWKSFSYLAEKEVRDKANGKGFARQQLTGEEDGCGVCGRGYAKCRSTEPFIIAPFDSSLSRIFTPIEHARIKGIPEKLVEGLSATRAHEILGQSVIYPAFQAVGRLIAETIKATAVNLLKTQHAKPAEEAFCLTA